MDEDLRELVEKAAQRGSRYLKGEVTLKEIPWKLAELGVFLLEKTKMLSTIHEDKLRGELIEIQNQIDDLRKVIFAGKIQIR